MKQDHQRHCGFAIMGIVALAMFATVFFSNERERESGDVLGRATLKQTAPETVFVKYLNNFAHPHGHRPSKTEFDVI